MRLQKTIVFILILSIFSGFNFVFAQETTVLKNGTMDTLTALKEKYRDQKIKILLVPGHDPEFFGTKFKDAEEEYFNMQLGQKIYDYFSANNKFDIYITRNKNGYLPIFSDYFKNNRKKIENFISSTYDNFISNFPDYEFVDGVGHNDAEKEVALRLFGINIWADENAVDLIIHVHFNDYAGRKKNMAGEYSGFNIYIPEKQMPNHLVSLELARPVFDNLKKIIAVSNLPKEDVGIVEDQNLIAMGPRFSLNAASMLIEYGYIYDIYNITPAIRKNLFTELASLTYSGIANYFNSSESVNLGSSILPVEWNKTLNKGMKKMNNIFALQIALVKEGVYPPDGLTLRDCPITGNFLKCTELAVKQFQEKYSSDILESAGLKKSTGEVGYFTRQKLNSLFSR